LRGARESREFAAAVYIPLAGPAPAFWGLRSPEGTRFRPGVAANILSGSDPSPGPRRLVKTPLRSTLSPRERAGGLLGARCFLAVLSWCERVITRFACRSVSTSTITRQPRRRRQRWESLWLSKSAERSAAHCPRRDCATNRNGCATPGSSSRETRSPANRLMR
jgi:hypothetical protein